MTEIISEQETDLLVKMKNLVEVFDSCLKEISLKSNILKNIIAEKSKMKEDLIHIIQKHPPYFNEETIQELRKDILLLQTKMNYILMDYCEHDIQEDYIDIYPEKSQKIQYCKKCLLTFTNMC